MPSVTPNFDGVSGDSNQSKVDQQGVSRVMPCSCCSHLPTRLDIYNCIVALLRFIIVVVDDLYVIGVHWNSLEKPCTKGERIIVSTFI